MVRLSFLFIIFLPLVIGCTNKKENSTRIAGPIKGKVGIKDQRFTDFNAVPGFIKTFLRTKLGETFAIANPGETWCSGCVQTIGKPSRQLVEAAINADSFTMRYWVGGIATVQRKMRIDLRDTTITGFAVDRQANPQSF